MKKENQFLQIIRGICIICVVFIHSMIFNEQNIFENNINIVLRTIINFCVATFIALSAYFVNQEKVNQNWKKFLVKKIKRLLIPFFLWSFIYTIIFVIKNHSDLNIIKLFANFILGKYSPQLYYLIVLFELVIITPILIKILKLKNRKLNWGILSISPLFALLNFAFCLKYKKVLPFYQYFFVAWITYYYLGLLIKENRLNISKASIFKVIFVLFISVVINVFLFSKGLIYQYCTSQIKFTNTMYSVFVILLIFKIAELRKEYEYKNNFRYLKVIGDYSFGIYLSHYLWIILVRWGINKINCRFNNILLEFITAILVLIFSVISMYLVKKITKNKLDMYIGF